MLKMSGVQKRAFGATLRYGVGWFLGAVCLVKSENVYCIFKV